MDSDREVVARLSVQDNASGDLDKYASTWQTVKDAFDGARTGAEALGASSLQLQATLGETGSLVEGLTAQLREYVAAGGDLSKVSADWESFSAAGLDLQQTQEAVAAAFAGLEESATGAASAVSEVAAAQEGAAATGSAVASTQGQVAQASAASGQGARENVNAFGALNTVLSSTNSGFGGVLEALSGGGGLIATLGGAAAGAGLLAKIVGDDNAAAMDSEMSIARLSTTLRANVTGWDGNTTAIERTIAARMRYGADDEEQRNALARTVTVTKDVTEALDIEATAMDLAAFMGMNLNQATVLLIRSMESGGGALRRYGVDIRDGATATEVLAAVQKTFAGQAESAANTAAGSAARAKIAFDELRETMGGATLPTTTRWVEALGDLGRGFDSSAQKARGAGQTWQETFASVLYAQSPLGMTEQALRSLADVFGLTADNAQTQATKIATSTEIIPAVTMQSVMSTKTTLDELTTYYEQTATSAGDSGTATGEGYGANSSSSLDTKRTAIQEALAKIKSDYNFIDEAGRLGKDISVGYGTELVNGIVVTRPSLLEQLNEDIKAFNIAKSAYQDYIKTTRGAEYVGGTPEQMIELWRGQRAEGTGADYHPITPRPNEYYYGNLPLSPEAQAENDQYFQQWQETELQKAKNAAKKKRGSGPSAYGTENALDSANDAIKNAMETLAQIDQQKALAGAKDQVTAAQKKLNDAQDYYSGGIDDLRGQLSNLAEEEKNARSAGLKAIQDQENAMKAFRAASEDALHAMDEDIRRDTLRLEDMQEAAQQVRDAFRDQLTALGEQDYALETQQMGLQKEADAARERVQAIADAYDAKLIPMQERLNELKQRESEIDQRDELRGINLSVEQLGARLANETDAIRRRSLQDQIDKAREQYGLKSEEYRLEGDIARTQAEKDRAVRGAEGDAARIEDQIKAIEKQRNAIAEQRREVEHSQQVWEAAEAKKEAILQKQIEVAGDRREQRAHDDAETERTQQKTLDDLKAADAAIQTYYDTQRQAINDNIKNWEKSRDAALPVLKAQVDGAQSVYDAMQKAYDAQQLANKEGDATNKIFDAQRKIWQTTHPELKNVKDAAILLKDQGFKPLSEDLDPLKDKSFAQRWKASWSPDEKTSLGREFDQSMTIAQGGMARLRDSTGVDAGIIIGHWDNMSAAVQRYLDKLAKLPGGTDIPETEKKAGGGPVAGGRLYWVGESGPELFVAPSNGYIVPNDQLTYTAGRGSGSYGGLVWSGDMYMPKEALGMDRYELLGVMDNWLWAMEHHMASR